MSFRRLRTSGPLALALAGGGIAAALVWAGPPGTDLAAHVFQRDLFLHHGFALWNNFWYAGRYSFVTYSVVYYPLAAGLGIRLLAALSAALAVFLFARVVEDEWGAPGRWSSRAFAVVWPLSVLSGAFPFMLGATFALAALRALQVRRRPLFAALALLTLGASPPAFVLLAVIVGGLGLAASGRSGRILAPAVVLLGGGVLELVLRRLFPDSGRYPFSALELLGGCVFCVLGLVLTWSVHAARVLRVVFGVYLGAILLVYAVPSALGENVMRLRFAAIPLAALALSLRRWRPLPVSVAVFLLACSWNLTPLGFSFVQGATDPSASRAYWAPALQFLRRDLSPSYRAEVVNTAGHWGAYYLADAGVPLARGWFSQDDFPQNAPLYGPLTRGEYLRWLRRLGIRYVVLTDAPLDFSARREAVLVRSGRSGLHPVFRVPHLTIFSLPRPTSIVTGPGRPRVLELSRSGLQVELPRPGTYRLAVRYSPYWRASTACISETEDGMTRLAVARPGIADLDLHFTAARAVGVLAGLSPTCS